MRRIPEREALKVFHLAGLRPIEPFPGARFKWKSECVKCGSIVSPAFSSIKSGASRGCASCARAKSAELQRMRGQSTSVSVLADADLRLLGDYRNAKTPIDVQCVLCERKFTTTQASVKSGTVKCECKKVARKPLSVHYPDLAAELHPTKNSGLAIERIGTGMKESIWWLCPEGHEFTNSPSNRVSQCQRCPYCEGSKAIPGKNDFKTLFPEKYSELRAKPENFDTIHPKSNVSFKWICKNNPLHEYEAQVIERTNGSGCPYCAGKRVMAGENDLETLFPDVAKEWDYGKNSGRPSDFSAHSNKKKWWVCRTKPDTHFWEVNISSRAKGNGCPYCGHQRLLRGDNDLATLHPKLAELWHPEKNGDLKPTDLIAGSGKPVFWQCQTYTDHYWASPPNRMLTKGFGCPTCSNYKLKVGFNDLKSQRPDLASEWAYDLNELRPQDLVFGSHKKVWWRCKIRDSHVWETSPMARRDGKGCPFCGGRRVDPGFNDLASQAPEVAREWDIDKNGGRYPETVNYRSNQKAHWLCHKDSRHAWTANISSRVNGNGCPVCSGYLTIPGVNDLESVNPELARQWISSKNGQKPRDISPGSTKKVWWRCQTYQDHEWEASVSSRHRLGAGCPICANLKVKVGFNDLKSRHPGVASEWHSHLNTLTSEEVVSGTNQLFWWQCPSVPEHTWRASVKNRVKGKGCPECSPAGYSASKPGTFYFLKHSEMGAMKVGITNGTEKLGRLPMFRKHGWEIVQTWSHSDGIVALATETMALRWIRKTLNLPPFLRKEDMPRTGGWTETFSSDLHSENKVKQALNNIWQKSIENQQEPE